MMPFSLREAFTACGCTTFGLMSFSALRKAYGVNFNYNKKITPPSISIYMSGQLGVFSLKRLDLEPTDENIVASLKSDLALRHEDIARFISLLDGIEPPFSICIDAPWGDGKTFFVKSVKMILEARNLNIDEYELESLPSWVIDESALSTEPSGFLPFYFNAWSNDMLGNPLGSIVASIAADCEVGFSISNTSIIEKAAKVIDSIGGLLGHSPNLAKLKDVFSGEQWIDEYRNRRELENEIDSYVQEVLREKASTLVLFIDELDCCRPEYAMRLLGDIKNLFENKSVIIVYSTDLEQLANALEGFYGSAFHARKYLERFYDKRFEMSPVRKKAYFNETIYAQYDLSRFDSIVNELMHVLPETMRDINRLKENLQEAKAFATRRRSDSDWTIVFAEAGILPVLIFLEHESPRVWRDVRWAVNFDGVYELGKKSPAFIEFVDLALRNTYDRDDEPDDDMRSAYIRHICALVFIDENNNDPRRKDADNELGHMLWRMPDIAAIRSFDFRKYNQLLRADVIGVTAGQA